MKTLNFFALLMTLAYLRTAYAGDYVQDPAPVYGLPNSGDKEPYKKPVDPDVCHIYLKNLQYLARHNRIMSCGQEVAPALMEKIKPVTWVNLDPRKYADIFLHNGLRTLDDKSSNGLKNYIDLVVRGRDVFRMASLNISGRAIYLDEDSLAQATEIDANGNRNHPIVKFHIFQYGQGDGDASDPQSNCRCKPTNKNSAHQMVCTKFPGRGNAVERNLFMVNEGMSRVFGTLWGEEGGERGQNLWLINNRPYSERARENGEVTLSEINTENPGLEPVCKYTYRNTNIKIKGK